jgi:hypothetical protein
MIYMQFVQPKEEGSLISPISWELGILAEQNPPSRNSED